jgi:hypothetical protein
VPQAQMLRAGSGLQYQIVRTSRISQDDIQNSGQGTNSCSARDGLAPHFDWECHMCGVVQPPMVHSSALARTTRMLASAVGLAATTLIARPTPRRWVYLLLLLLIQIRTHPLSCSYFCSKRHPGYPLSPEAYNAGMLIPHTSRSDYTLVELPDPVSWFIDCEMPSRVDHI